MMTLFCIDWTVALSVISAIAAISGVIVAILSWWQMVDARRARIIVSLKSQNGAFLLVVMNVGYSPAKEIQFTINKELLEALAKDSIKGQFASVEKASFTLLGGDKKQLLICFDNNEKMKSLLSKTPIIITGSYRDTYSQYNPIKKINEKLVYSEYITKTAIISDQILNRVTEITNDVNAIKEKIVKDDTAETK